MAQKNKNINYKTNIKNNNNNNIINNNQFLIPKVKESPMSSQNINGASNSKIMPKHLLIQKDNNINPRKKIAINNNLNNDNNKENARNKLMDLVQKKKVSKPNFDKNKNKGINVNNKGKNIIKEINKNEEFQKIIEKIGVLESSEMNYDLYTRLNLIKNYINMKGDKMSSEDLINIDNDIQSMMNSINNTNFKFIKNKK